VNTSSPRTAPDAGRVAIKRSPGGLRWRLIAVALGTLVALVATAGQAQAKRYLAAGSAAEGAPATCIVHSLPSFIAQGEQFPQGPDLKRGLSTAASVADVVEVECNPSIYGTGSKIKLTASQLFSRCKERLTWYVVDPYRVEQGKGVSVELDADGNATVALLAGPECAAGESLITAHMEEEPFETFTTSFTVLPPITTPPGVSAMPAAQVEDALSSGVATIIETEVANGSEQFVHIGSEELFHRCRVTPHLHWIRMDRSEQAGVAEVARVQLDNDGNAFVIVIGDSSCAPGDSLIEADLESKPFTTFTTTFTIQPPQPTAEPSFSIEKRQEISGSESGFTVAPLKASLGQKVNYEIIVTNTSTVPETFSELTDAHCEAIAGGPGSSALGPGEKATYTCHHVLMALGPYTNEATVTATTLGGTPLTQTSNQVVVNVAPKPAESEKHNKNAAPPSFTIEKLQAVVGFGGFTASLLTPVTPGATINYEIIVKNTGQVPLTFANFTDAHCDPGTIAGGPGEASIAPGNSTLYTCRHVMGNEPSYVNQASVTGAAQGQPPLTQNSNPVEVRETVKPCSPTSLRVRGATGPKRGPFTAHVSSRAIKLITLLLDGRKLTTLKPSAANGGRFAVKIDARKLSYGAHRLSVKPLTSTGGCGAAALSSVFVHPRPPVPPPG
jgi:hypothetical protein